MSAYIAARKKYQDAFVKKHGVKLGFMSGFVKAATHALKEQPVVNAVIDGDSIVYRDFIDISVAVSSPTGLVVPVLRNCQDMGFQDVEKNIVDYGNKAMSGKMAIEDMQGGTFTISNGGVFGSMMGTPIINLPQSAILGMHATKVRPVVVDGKIVARPIMYVALTYDHRIIDGREAVLFLRKIKESIEDP
jgi:2-oxoglutarate dehydrogenase E2 component (dihydrolipoamide succinyltransferase)